MRKSDIRIIVILIASLFIGGCYTKIKITRTKEGAEKRWETENKYDYYRHNPCRWCSDWNYYYDYPWWLDQYWWWEHYSPAPQLEKEKQRERYERRRGLGETIESIFEGLDSSERPRQNSSDDDTEEEDTNKTDERPERRRGL